MIEIKNPELLTNDTQDVSVIGREEQKKEINFNLLQPLKNNQIGHPLYIYGMPGTGKTLITTSLVSQLQKEVNNPNLVCEYFHPTSGLTTEYTLVCSFLRNKLKSYLPINMMGTEISSIPLHGWDISQLYQVMWHIIDNNNLTVLLVIDEIDKIIKKSGDEFLQKFIDSYNFLKNGSFYFIGISNDPNLDRNFSLSIKARYKFKILFPKYKANDLLDILKYFASQCLPANTYTDRDLAVIAKHVADYSGSARDAKMTLYNLALMSNGSLQVENDIQAAIEKSEVMMLESSIVTLPFDEKLILLSIIDSYKEYRKVMEARGDKIAQKVAVTTGNIYNYYKRACNTFGPMEPKNMYAFKKVIKYFDQSGFINLTAKSFGRRGLTTEIVPLLTIDTIEPMLLKSIKEEM